MNLPLVNTDCVGQDELCKVESSNNFKTLKQDDYKEPDYIELNNFTPNIGSGISKSFC